MYGEVCILNFTQVSQNILLSMKYWSAKDCKCMSYSFNSTCKTNSPLKYFQKSLPSTVIYRLTFGSEVHGLYN